ncbi:phospho-N-acetylmuramoyl-pentapeptide-transferase [Caulobacter sp. Root1455]|uniref:phospho-N-acetylmuramoyl-pentapeptide- transferase n=1 Tax=unclassified Caulobacter TaxID=2648921 RepID=UPI0006F32780|nr:MULTISPECIES: phospho-N-acetylmuramoyl-pentapeptide-transferase [unclassified Caulobacter]KQY34351.1 phospho-N-acetylmuramoyl-pentapeptide-transferase [Caulobacter sp. Root487D2Y]KQZ03225.1 phospho-N-acetylmuramoyl-pentapeptide-transferase [Caulobacter sp. Root1455]
MLYFLYNWLSQGGHEHVPVLNLLKYLTFRTGMSMLTAYVVAVAMGSRFIRWMKAKQGKGQPIRTDGIARHVTEKAGTPTMGGFMILAGLFVGSLLFADLRNVHVWVVLGITAAFGVLGFMDDYAKVTKQTTAGLSSGQKLIAQFIISILAAVALILFAPKSQMTPGLETSLVFPILKNLVINMGWFYVAFAAVTIAGFSNAVNLTDGLDGLAIVPVMFAASTFGLIAYLVGNYKFAGYLNLHFVPSVGELAVVCGAIIGGGMGFLWYNAPPAKIFMGDTGSLALGGALGSIAVCAKHELVLGIVGGLFVAEALSVMIQVAYFKKTKKRIFLMAPIHHHFEKLGWAESTVVVRFWIVAMMLSFVGLATLKLR